MTQIDFCYKYQGFNKSVKHHTNGLPKTPHALVLYTYSTEYGSSLTSISLLSRPLNWFFIE